MLEFYGFRAVAKEPGSYDLSIESKYDIELLPIFPTAAGETWLQYRDHNHNRVTRYETPVLLKPALHVGVIAEVFA